MKTSLLQILRCLFLALCPGLIWAQDHTEISLSEITAPALPKFSYVKVQGSDDANVQFYLTTALALAAGFEQDKAISIGLHNQFVDDHPKTSASPLFNFKARRQYHFTSAKQREKLWQEFLNTRDVAQLSMYLHALQDSYYHKGFGWVFGHMFAGHKPDQSWRVANFGKNQEVAQLTFQKLCEAAPIMEQNSANLTFDKFADAVRAFLQAPNPEAQTNTYSALCAQIVEFKTGDRNAVNSMLARIHQSVFSYEKNLVARKQAGQIAQNRSDNFPLQTLHVGQD